MNLIAPLQQEKHDALSAISGKLGTLSTRLAETTAEIQEAQHLRYKVFCEEMSAQKNTARLQTRREEDAHDAVCDHLLVIDQQSEGSTQIVGTQRFFVKSANEQKAEFYSQSEFDLEGLAARHPDKRFMELGRSCILPAYRGKRTMELMWHGTWAYALHQKTDVMVGCASFEADRFETIAPGLGFLANNAACSAEWNAPARGSGSMPLTSFANDPTNPRKALAGLPPLIKGYLRLGARFASHAVPDRDFGTIDILVVLPVATINPRYVNYYGADASRHREQAQA